MKMITRQPVHAPRLRLLSGRRRTWLQRFWDVEELFEFKLTLLVAVALLGATLGA
jgi:hypothetical protein